MPMNGKGPDIGQRVVAETRRWILRSAGPLARQRREQVLLNFPASVLAAREPALR